MVRGLGDVELGGEDTGERADHNRVLRYGEILSGTVGCKWDIKGYVSLGYK